MKTGKGLSNKAKILILCLLRYFMNLSPNSLKDYFNIPVRGASIETDVKFRIGTIQDFFVFSPVAWERRIAPAFAFHEGMNFLDVGAHIGKYTVRAGLKVGKQGRVIAIEPNRRNFQRLVQNINLNGLTNCVPLNIAAYSAETELALFSGNDSAKNSVKRDFGRGSQKVRARMLDNVLKEIRIEKLDLIKIDVEEAEYDVVKGLERTLRLGNPIVIIEMERKDESRVIKFLRSLGYKENLLLSYEQYKSGLMFYSFRKQTP